MKKGKVRYSNLLISCITIFFICHLTDSVSTIIGLFYQPPGKSFVEGGNVFIRFFMYDLNLGKNGFFIGDLITLVFEIFYIYVRSRDLWGKFQIFFFISFLIFFGTIHFISGVHNIILIVTAPNCCTNSWDMLTNSCDPCIYISNEKIENQNITPNFGNNKIQ